MSTFLSTPFSFIPLLTLILPFNSEFSFVDEFVDLSNDFMNGGATEEVDAISDGFLV